MGKTWFKQIKKEFRRVPRNLLSLFHFVIFQYAFAVEFNGGKIRLKVRLQILPLVLIEFKRIK